MSTLTGKLFVTRGKQIDLLGKPVSTNPLVFGAPAKLGQLVFTTDTARLFIGHIPSVGDVNYNREKLPYQNIEILTENSPRTRELFSDFSRSLNENDYFLPALIATGNDQTLNFDSYAGNDIPAYFDSIQFTATVDYHAFINSDQTPVQNGRLTIVSTTSGTTITDSNVVNPNQVELTFDMVTSGSGKVLTCSNGNAQIKFYMRRSILTGISNGRLL